MKNKALKQIANSKLDSISGKKNREAEILTLNDLSDALDS